MDEMLFLCYTDLLPDFAFKPRMVLTCDAKTL